MEYLQNYGMIRDLLSFKIILILKANKLYYSKYRIVSKVESIKTFMNMTKSLSI